AAECRAGLVDDRPGTDRRRRRGALDEAGGVAARHEADLHALRLRRDRQPERRSLGAHLGLRPLPDRKADERQGHWTEREEEVRLVLRLVVRAPEHESAAAGMPREARVVAGRERRRAELARTIEEHAELHVLVAARARVRRLAREVLR